MHLAAEPCTVKLFFLLSFHQVLVLIFSVGGDPGLPLRFSATLPFPFSPLFASTPDSLDAHHGGLRLGSSPEPTPPRRTSMGSSVLPAPLSFQSKGPKKKKEKKVHGAWAVRKRASARWLRREAESVHE